MTFDQKVSTGVFWIGVGFVLFCLASALSGCGGDRVDYEPICEAPAVAGRVEPIVGGEPAEERFATAKVYLEGGFCSGTVIGPRTVLTAGHCRGAVRVVIRDEGSFPVVDEVVHPDYNGNVRFDVRVLYVERDLPLPFAPIAEDGLICSQLLTQGYGIGGDGGLYERTVETVARYDEVIVGTESICNGDSGGPLYALQANGGFALVGVNSFGFGEAGVCNGPVGFANLLILGDWVNGQIN